MGAGNPSRYPGGEVMAPRKRGRPGNAEALNLLSNDLEEVAEAVKLQLYRLACSRRSILTATVHVSPEGDIRIAVETLPASWLIGNYRLDVSCRQIEQDLKARLAEIL